MRKLLQGRHSVSKPVRDFCVRGERGHERELGVTSVADAGEEMAKRER